MLNCEWRLLNVSFVHHPDLGMTSAEFVINSAFEIQHSELLMPSVVISARGEERIRAGHPWIYRSDVVDVHAGGGDIVEVIGPRRRRIGSALFSDQSQISLRVLTVGENVADESLLRTRIEAAIRVRESLALDASAYRVVHGEADLLPSLIVDRYGDYLAVQALSQGTDRLLPGLTSMLVDLLKPAGILARNDPKVRALEGLEQSIAVLHGDVPESVMVREGPIEYDVDMRKGQKTGLFLDQRENREAAERYAHGRLLDCFSYTGGFALRLARKCPEAEALDISADAIERIRANAIRNGVPHLQAREVNVFDELRRLERSGARYDTIVLDPPAFAKNKASIPNAMAGYKEINLRAMRLLNPGGYLITCSCSYNVNEEMFAEVIHQASIDSHTPVAIVEKRIQGRDHPVLVGVPETYYLKCFILRRVE
jgi:23S rRNA (cytosine1962-C5)-methyltransferase